MKMEIDLNDILGDEYGTESIEESVRRQVTEYLVGDFKKKVGRVIDEQISEKVETLINEQLAIKFPEMIEDIWNMEYTPVTRYGEKVMETTTLKNEIIKTITNQLVYKKTSYRSDQNRFTEAVDASLDKAMAGFKKEFDETVTKEFRKEAFAYALKQLTQK